MNHRIRSLVPVLAVMFFAAPAVAAVPGTTLIEGVLNSAGGGPAADGNYKFTFSLYGAAKGGSAAWSEADVAVAVKNGRFAYALGATKPIDAGKVAALSKAWLGIKVGTDPELPRQALHSVIFAMHAKTAGGLSCKNCVGKDALSNGSITSAKVQFAYAKAADGIKGGAAADLKCTGCVSSSTEIKWDGNVNLGGRALAAGKLTSAGDVVAGGIVAGKQFVGDGSKLTGIQKVSGSCKTGQAVVGINGDGTVKCASAGIAPDNLNEVSNDLLTNQFTDTIPGMGGDITDNSPSGLLAAIDFPDIGIAQDIQVNVSIANSDITNLTVFLFPPNAPVLPKNQQGLVQNFPGNPTVDGNKYKHYLLHKKSGKKGAAINTTFPGKTKPVAGDIHKDWIGKNPKGQWRLFIVDSAYLNNKIDGKLISWSISLKTLSNKKVGVQGSAYVHGTLWGKDNGHGKHGGHVDIGGGMRFQTHTTCDAKHVGVMRNDPMHGLQICQWNADTANKGTYEWFAAKSQPIIFSGGCKSSPGSNGYRTYCLDGSDFNTAGDYLDPRQNGYVYIKKAGYYRINFMCITHSGSWAHIKVIKNGWHYIHHGHARSPHSSWVDNFADLVWPFRKGDWVRVDVYKTGGSHNYHSWSHGQNSGGMYAGAYGRLQIEYKGPLRGASAVRPTTAPKTCLDIKKMHPQAHDGLHYIDPDGPGGWPPVETYCDMTTDGGGWTLVSYSPHRASWHNMFDLQCGGSMENRNWDPDGRGFPAAIRAVEIAQNSKEILFAHHDTRHIRGNINAYSSAYAFNIPDPKLVNFVPHSQHGGHTGTGTNHRGPCVAVKLKVYKGNKSYQDKVRYTFKHSLGTTWSDSYPTGYGATNDSNCIGSSGMTLGPMFISVHSGDGRGKNSSRFYSKQCNVKGKTIQSIKTGQPYYGHHEHWLADKRGRHGSAAIWLR